MHDLVVTSTFEIHKSANSYAKLCCEELSEVIQVFVKVMGDGWWVRSGIRIEVLNRVEV